MLSYVAQNGGATIGQLYSMFCSREAPFAGLGKDEFIELVKHLGQKELLMQESSGLLLHGRVGEKLVNHYTFYAAFAADEEFRIVCAGKALGTLPVSQMLNVGQRLLFAGKTWLVEEIDDQQKTIYVVRAPSGAPPLFSGGAGRTHTKVRQRMRELLEASEELPFLDDIAKKFVAEGRKNYVERNLARDFVVDQGRQLVLLTWLGDAGNEALACILRRRNYTVNAAGPGIEVQKGESSTSDVVDALFDAAVDDPPPLDMLLADVSNLQREKWDWALPDALLRKAYGSLHLDIGEALAWAKSIARKEPH